jgi:hypothetical protein
MKDVFWKAFGDEVVKIATSVDFAKNMLVGKPPFRDLIRATRGKRPHTMKARLRWGPERFKRPEQTRISEALARQEGLLAGAATGGDPAALIRKDRHVRALRAALAETDRFIYRSGPA